jgi:hypothetical protein
MAATARKRGTPPAADAFLKRVVDVHFPIRWQICRHAGARALFFGRRKAAWSAGRIV